MPFAPVGIYDHDNRLVYTTESDYSGLFDTLLPSTNRISCPTPSGVCANVYRFVGNDPGVPGRLNTNYKPDYRTIAAEFEAMPGNTIPADLAPTQVGVSVQLPGGQAVAVQCVAPASVPQLFAVSKPYVLGAGSFTIKGVGFGPSPGGTVALDAHSDHRHLVERLDHPGDGAGWNTGRSASVAHHDEHRADPRQRADLPRTRLGCSAVPQHAGARPIQPRQLEQSRLELEFQHGAADHQSAARHHRRHDLRHIAATNTLWGSIFNPFGANQEAYATITQLGTASSEFGLVLKSGIGAIRVVRTNTNVQVRTTANFGLTWQTQATFPAAVPVGSVLGARASAGGTVAVYVNGSPIGR